MAGSTSTASPLVLTPVSSETSQPAINQHVTSPVKHVNTDQSAPQMEDFNITKEKRQQLRGLLHNSQSLAPDENASQSRSNGASLTYNERNTYHTDLDEAIRWNLFLTHTDLNLNRFADFVSSIHNVNEEEHRRAFAKAVRSHESYKTTTCSNIKEHAISIIRANLNIRQLDDVALTQKISDSFSPDKFFAAFAFMEDYLNFEGSSPLGKWFAEGIYVNIVRTLV
jgi:hypothetical protein